MENIFHLDFASKSINVEGQDIKSRRSKNRYLVNLPISIWTEKEILKRQVFDISLSGLMVLFSKKDIVPEELIAKVYLGENEVVTIKANATWKKGNKVGYKLNRVSSDKWFNFVFDLQKGTNKNQDKEEAA